MSWRKRKRPARKPANSGSALLVCFAALYWGHQQVAMVLGSTMIVALAAVFVIGRLPWFK